MSTTYQDKIANFNEQSLPDLDEVVLAALEFLGDATLPKLDVHKHARPLVVGSGNALPTGRALFAGTPAVFADEGTFISALRRVHGIDSIYVISASGGKHAVEETRLAEESGLPAYLITSNSAAPTHDHVPAGQSFIFPHIREPYTYNTSTYLGMMLGVYNESPKDVLAFIAHDVDPCIPDTFAGMTAFTLIVEPEFEVLTPMLDTKFDELFGPMVSGRAFSSEEIKHAKTVVPSHTECFISFGVNNMHFGRPDARIPIPLPDNCGPVAMLAIAYYVIGRIQKQKPQYFKEHIVEYTRLASEIFGQHIEPIVP